MHVKNRKVSNTVLQLFQATGYEAHSIYRPAAVQATAKSVR